MQLTERPPPTLPRYLSALIALLLGATLSENAFARASNVCFTIAEVKKMESAREAFSREGSQCLQAYWATHTRFFKENKYSRYFGNQNSKVNTPDRRALAIALVLKPRLLSATELKRFSSEANRGKRPDKDGELPSPGLSDLERWLEKNNPKRFQAWLKEKPALRLTERSTDEAEVGPGGAVDWSKRRPTSNLKLQNISCIDMTRRCLRMAFEKVGMLSTFQKIDSEVKKNGVSGVELQKALLDLGWKSYYFNPNTAQNAIWDQEDQKIDPAPAGKSWNASWGAHASHWNRNCTPNGTKKDPAKPAGVQCSDLYHLGKQRPVPIDDKKLLVNFGTSVPASFKTVPFWVGTVHSGYHAFSGFVGGQLIEAHAFREIQSRDNLEVSTFNPLDQANRGGPRWSPEERYRSGVIVIPPGYLEVGGLYAREPKVDASGCVELRREKK